MGDGSCADGMWILEGSFGEGKENKIRGGCGGKEGVEGNKNRG